MAEIKNKLKEIIGKFKLKDVGEKRRGLEPCCSPKPSKDKKYYPHTYFTVKQIPNLSGLEVDDDFMLILKCRISSHSMNESPDRKNEEFGVEIRSAAVVSDKK